MGSRGPKPGFKQRRAEQAAAASQADAPQAAAPELAAASPIPEAQPAVPPAVAPPDEPPAAVVVPAPKPEPRKSRAKPELSASDRENPDKISGQDLRDLAHKRGIAKSLLPSMSDEKIRTELRYATYRQYEGEDAVA